MKKVFGSFINIVLVKITFYLKIFGSFHPMRAVMTVHDVIFTNTYL